MLRGGRDEAGITNPPVAFHSDKEHGAPPERKTQLDAAFQILQRAADNRRDGD
jgi:hypothetical protein